MVIIWMVMHERPDKKYDKEDLREDAKMTLEKTIKEIVAAAGKLKYEIFNIRENSISLMKIGKNDSKDISLMTIVGTPEEILALQMDERVKKFIR